MAFRQGSVRLLIAAGLLALPSTAALSATIEMQVIPCEPPLRPDECGVKINAINGTATFTSSSGETVTVSPGQALSVSGNGIMSSTAQNGTMLNFASAGSGSQTGSVGGEGAAGAGGGGGGGQTAGLPSGGGGGAGGGSAASGGGGGGGGSSTGSGGGSGGGGGGSGGGSGGGGGLSGGGGGGSDGTTTSDVRLKHDITMLGKLDSGLGFYRFAYNGENKAYVGVMAQEVEQVMPEAVVRGPDGYLRVRYEALGLRFESYDEWVASGAKIPTRGALEHAH